MRYYLLIVLFFPALLLAQNPFNVHVETRSGYEYNAFNGHKNKPLLDTNGDSINSIQNGFYQRLTIRGTWKKQLKVHKFGLSAKVSKDEFWTLKRANLFRSHYQFSYSYQIKRTAVLYYKTQFASYQTNRAPDATAIINIPSAYKRLSGNLGYKFQPFTKNKTQIEVTALQKNYPPNKQRQLSYFDFGFELNTTQRFKKKGKPSSYLNLLLAINQRNYVDTPTSNFLDLEKLEAVGTVIDSLKKHRTWAYQTLQIDYTFKINKAIKINSGISFQQRLDILDKKYGYQQWQPFVELEWKTDKLKFQWKVAGTFRTFTHLKADKNGAFALKHQYLRSNFLATYNLRDNLVLSGQVNLQKRWRNQPSGATNN